MTHEEFTQAMKKKGMAVEPEEAEPLVMLKDGSIVRAVDLYPPDPDDDENVPWPG